MTDQQPKTGRYMIKPHLRPSGLELQMEDAQHNLVYRVISKETRPQQYLFYSLEESEISPLEIKPSHVGAIRRYKLFQNKAKLLTLQQGSSSMEFFLRDGQSNIVARFNPVTPVKILLSSSTRVVARLRFLEYPQPIGFRIVCDVETDNRWLFAVIMYAVALIQEIRTQKISSKDEVNTP